MTYDAIDASAADGRPYFLYQFVEGEQVWCFTSRADAWSSVGSGGDTISWDPAAVAHGDIVQTGEIERGRLELTWPLSHPFARRFLAPLENTPVTLTIFRGHEQVLGETVAHWDGRVVGAEAEGQRILRNCESIFSTLRRAGVRAKYQRLCRHALYGRGCRWWRLGNEGYRSDHRAGVTGSDAGRSWRSVLNAQWEQLDNADSATAVRAVARSHSSRGQHPWG